MNQSEIGVGIIGYSIGKVHAHAWKGVDEYFHPKKLKPKLVAISGRSREKLELEASRFGFKRSYSDWRQLVDDREVQIVDNCSPPSIHPEPMIRAAELGKQLFCEKPLARNSEEAKTMLDAAERAKVKHMVGYNYRFLPAVLLAKKLIESGEMGRIYFFKGAYLNVNEGYDNPKFPYGWHHDSKIAGYGALSDLGTHAIDLARFLVGEISSVCGAKETFIKERPLRPDSDAYGTVDVDDLAIACMKFESGALGTLESCWLTAGRTDYLRFEIYGSRGSIRYNLERISELEVFKRGGDRALDGFRKIDVLNKEFHPYMKHYWSNQGGGFSWEHSFVNEFNHFIDCIADDKPVSPSGATFLDGYRNCRIMDAVVESSNSEKWVGTL